MGCGCRRGYLRNEFAVSPLSNSPQPYHVQRALCCAVAGALQEEIRKKTGYIIQRAEGVFDVDANTSIEDLAEAFQVSIPPESTYYETVSGFVCEAFGYIPRTGDKKVIRLRRSVSDEEESGNSVRPSGPSSPIRGGKQRGEEDDFARGEEEEGREKEDDKSCPRDKDYKTFRIEVSALCGRVASGAWEDHGSCASSRWHSHVLLSAGQPSCLVLAWSRLVERTSERWRRLQLRAGRSLGTTGLAITCRGVPRRSMGWDGF